MGERNADLGIDETAVDLFEPVLGDLADDEFDKLNVDNPKARSLAEKRRRAEQRLEEKRMRDELGYDDLEFDDF